MKSLFVAGTGTDLGKTHVACALLRAARARSVSVDAFKPVVSAPATVLPKPRNSEAPASRQS